MTDAQIKAYVANVVKAKEAKQNEAIKKLIAQNKDQTEQIKRLEAKVFGKNHL
jgi:hypothetical protein